MSHTSIAISVFSAELAMIAVEFIFLIARTDADDRAATRLHVEKPDLLHKAHRIIEGQYEDGGAQPDFARHAGAVGGHHQGRGANRIVGEMMLREPGDIEADLVGKLHHRGRCLR